MDAPGAKTQHGYLVLADISGYTAYLAGTELEHAQEILSELLELIMERLTPMLTLSKLEGDAVFVYAPEARFTRGEALLELVEATYVAFKDRVESIRRRTTCQCNACRAIPTLDLKFMAHHGDYVVQNVAGIHELAGSDVNLVHRLLKNHITEATGWRAYALFTEKSLSHMDVKPDQAGLHLQIESYEHLGEVQTYSLNLLNRYKEIAEVRRVIISPEEADLIVTQVFPAPAPVVWDWWNDPYKRNQVDEHAVWSVVARPGGRTGVGARNHCAHGKGMSVETVLDWRPFDYVTTETREGKMLMYETIQLEPLPDGRTRIRSYTKMPLPLPHWARRIVAKFMLVGMMKYDQWLAKSAHTLGRTLTLESAPAEPAALYHPSI